MITAQGDDLLRTVKELRVSTKLSSEIGPDEIIKISADFANQTGKSFDIDVVKQGGALLRKIEITTIDKDVLKATDFTLGIKHGMGKAKHLPKTMSGTREISIYADFPRKAVRQGNCQLKFKRNDLYEKFTKDLGRSIGKGDLIDELVQHTPKISDSDLLTHINLYSKTDNKVIALLEKKGKSWVIQERMP